MGTNDRIVRIAERRLDVVTSRDFQRLGLDQRNAARHAARGALQHLTGDVYATSVQRASTEQWELALCLGHPSAVVSHSSAAAFWGLRRAVKGRIEVTIPKGDRLRGTPAVVHHSNLMPDDHVVEVVDGRRVTSVARTVFDLGGASDALGHRSLVEDARNKGLCSDAELGEVYRTLACKGRRGSAAWERIADLVEQAAPPVMSELELALHDALVARGLPAPVRQHPVRLPSGRTVHIDLAYPSWSVAVEADHSAWHTSPSAVENDKARDVGLITMGWATMRFTERALERMLWCVECVAEVLAQRGCAVAA